MSLKALTEQRRVFTDEELVRYCIDEWDYTWEVNRFTRDRWDLNWATYNNQFDFSEKANWQSQNYLSKFKMAVRITRSILKQSIIKSDRFFKFVGLNDQSRDVEKDIEETLLRLLSQSDFKERQFSRGVFLGLLENLIAFKVYPVTLTDSDAPLDDNQDTKIVITPVSMYDLSIDKRGKRTIHRIKMELSDYRSLVKRGVYRRDSLDELEANFAKEDAELKEKIRNNEVDIPRIETRKEVELLEFWGDVDDDIGERVYENTTFTIVNRRAVARSPIDNPYRHGKAPFVHGPIFEKYGSTYHEGFADPVIGLARMINETLNIILDANLAASVKAFEVNMDYVHNPSALKSGIYPGKTIQTRGVPPGGRAITEMVLGEVHDSSSLVLQFLDREFQNNTGVNEFIGAFLGTGEKTATEVKTKSAQSMSLMQAIAEDIEDNVLEPLIEMVYSLQLQYNPEVFGQRVNNLPINVLRFKFNAKGMSKMLSGMEEMQRMFMLINMFQSTPIATKINWESIGKEAARMANLDASKIFTTEQVQPVTVGQGPTGVQQAQGESAQGNVVNLKQLLGSQ